MKKILIVLAFLVTQSFALDIVNTGTYVTSVSTKNKNVAKAFIRGSDGLVSANIGRFLGTITVNTIYATTYLNVPSTDGGISTDNAYSLFVKATNNNYVTNNYNSSITINGSFSVTSSYISIGKTPYDRTWTTEYKASTDGILFFYIEQTGASAQTIQISVRRTTADAQVVWMKKGMYSNTEDRHQSGSLYIPKDWFYQGSDTGGMTIRLYKFLPLGLQ